MDDLGKKAVIIGRNGKKMVVDLDYWDEASQSYEGPGKFRGTIKVKVIGGTEGLAGFFGGQQFGWTEATIMPVFLMRGLKPYPQEVRPGAGFQYVLLGEDTSVLSRVAPDNAPTEVGESSGGNAPAVHPADSDDDGKGPVHPADIDGDHKFHPKEVKKWNREHPDDKIEEGPY